MDDPTVKCLPSNFARLLVKSQRHQLNTGKCSCDSTTDYFQHLLINELSNKVGVHCKRQLWLKIHNTMNNTIEYNEQCFLVMCSPSQTGKHTAYIYCIDKVQTHIQWKVYITVQCASLTSNTQRQVLTYKQWYRAKITPDLYQYSHPKLRKWTIFIYFLFNHNYLKAKL